MKKLVLFLLLAASSSCFANHDKDEQKLINELGIVSQALLIDEKMSILDLTEKKMLITRYKNLITFLYTNNQYHPPMLPIKHTYQGKINKDDQ